MIVKSTKRFIRDIDKVKSLELIDEIFHLLDSMEQIEVTDDIPGFKKFKNYPGYGRVRIADYRIGVYISGKTITLKCILHRSVIYKHFPK